MVLRILGKTFIGAGIFIFLFLGYQLFGTNFVASREQKKLDVSFQQRLEQAAQTPTPIQTASPLPPSPGEGVARIIITKIEVDWVVVEGVEVNDLKKGPGHWPGTPLPGEPGNMVISGHRTTYGAPFFRLDELTAGDEITIVSLAGTHRYTVTTNKVVKPTHLADTTPTDDTRLTISTCHPRFSAAERLIIIAELTESVAMESRAA